MGKQVLSQSESGSFVGTGSAVNVSLGFKPRLIVIYNETDGDVCWIGFDGMADGKCLQIDTAVSFLSSNGLTLKAGGFTAGTSLSESGDTMRFIAFS